MLDAFTIGGAQISGGRRSRDFQLENELEFTVKKAHQMEFGATITGSSYSVDEVRNTNGTFTFASLEMYQAGIPTTYTQRTINPNGGYSLHRFGWYLQDSYRVNRSVMISGAMRHDMQTRLSDWTNFSPRASISWTLPGRKTTLRSSIGVWPQFFEGGLYEQTLWANGQQQRDIVISNPGFPDPFLGGIPLAGQPPSIVRAHPGHRDAVHAARVGRRRSHVDELGEAARQLFASDRAQPVSQPRSERAQSTACGPTRTSATSRCSSRPRDRRTGRSK